MSTGLTWQTESTSLEATLALAAKVGKELRGGEVIELVSDLGGGKTSFVRGLSRGIGSEDEVRSPTFTLNNEYHSDRLTLHHFDFYRLSDPGILRNELAELIGDPQTAVAIEWAEIVEEVLPDDRLTIRIRATGENSRQFVFAYPESLRYIVQGLES